MRHMYRQPESGKTGFSGKEDVPVSWMGVPWVVVKRKHHHQHHQQYQDFREEEDMKGGGGKLNGEKE